jgi:hypothetical protein
MTELRYPDGDLVPGPMFSVAAHQPGYHRHLYYYAKMAAADVFVMLDTVQYMSREWQNRQAFWYAGRRRWLTVPVRRGRELLRDKTIIDHTVLRNHWRVLQETYRDAPYFGLYDRELSAIYATAWDRLVDLCAALDEVVVRGFGITTRRVRASQLLPDSDATRGRLLAELTLEAWRRAGQGAAPLGYLACAMPMRPDHYLRQRQAGAGQAEMEVMRSLGVQVVTFGYRPPRYPQYQLPRGHPFEPELSAFDLLFNHGPSARPMLLGSASGSLPPSAGLPDGLS